MGDPAWAKERIDFENAHRIRTPEDKYQYLRAYNNVTPYRPSGLTVLDPTAGGGSIPFEALRLGHKVIANELNPVATTILHATLDCPARFGTGLVDDIRRWGNQLLDGMRSQLVSLFSPSLLPEPDRSRLARLFEKDPELAHRFSHETLDGFLYARQVTCPHCGGEAPLLNTCWLSKEADDPWDVRVMPENGEVRFETYRVKGGHGPRGEDPNEATVNRGVDQCIHCRQAIDGDEIKRQARGESPYGRWQDRLYAVVAVRLEPKLDKHGRPERYASGTRAGEIKTRKVRFFRPPNERDLAALTEAERRLQANWERWDAEGLIPTEQIDRISNYDRGHRLYGMRRWCDMFTPRQLLGHLTLVEELRRLTPQILAELGEERGRAVVTYLQFAIDKGLDYNCRLTTWEFTRGVVKHIFARHDFSLKWTFGEMIFTGPNSGAAWGLSQVIDAYKGMAELVEPVWKGTSGQPPVRILNGTAAYMPQVGDRSVDLVCMDPPYYDNVQYAELSDYFYVWQKRILGKLYPGLFTRRLTDKKSEAVANPARDGSAAKVEYERMMGEIFRECRRVLKDDGLLTLMFTHKSQDAWETLTRSLIESGWVITACFPVEAESASSIHQMDMAAAASSIFIACRKRATDTAGPAVWQGFGGQGVRYDIEHAVKAALDDFAPLKLNPVDEMVASYGKALQVLSAHWPVQDGDELVSPIRAMNEASRVVSQTRVSHITRGKVKVEDLDSETAMALTLFGIWECAEVAYDDVLLLSKSLGIALEDKAAGYHVRDRAIGINPSNGVQTRRGDPSHYFAPLVRSRAKLRLALPEERQPARLEAPQTDWDRLHGVLMAYREGDIPVARAYVEKQAKERTDRIRALLQVWAAEARDPDHQREAQVLLFGLGR
jgi:adenine-specific DNA methylase